MRLFANNPTKKVTRPPVDWKKFNWLNMPEIIPEFTSGDVRFTHCEVNELYRSFYIARALSGYDVCIPEIETIGIVYIKGKLFMSDAILEKVTNAYFLERAHGHVFIAGLGMCAILGPLLSKHEVESVTIIERNKDLISAMSPVAYRIAEHVGYKRGLRIVHGNMFTYDGSEEEYDTIWLDIWPQICPRFLPQMRREIKRYSKFLSPYNSNPFIDCWSRDVMEGDSAEYEEMASRVDKMRADILQSEDTYDAFFRNGVVHMHPTQCKNGAGNVLNNMWMNDILNSAGVEEALRILMSG